MTVSERVQFNVRLDPHLVEAIDARRAALGLSRDKWMSRMVEFALTHTQPSPEAEAVGLTIRPVVYYLRRETDGAIKIGYTTKMGDRLRSLRYEHGTCTLLAAHPGGRREERALHQSFSAANIHGEWFRPEPALLDHIATLAAQT